MRTISKIAVILTALVGFTKLFVTPAVPSPVKIADEPIVESVMTGKVLPFSVFNAIRNYGFKNGMVGAFVSVGVVGGTRSDWASTAVYIAKHAIVKDVTFAQIEVFTLSPWGDRPPQRAKSLAKAYYSPVAGKSPWSEKFDVLLASKQASALDIEWDEIDSELSDKFDSIQDPDRKQAAVDRSATRLLIRNHHLPSNWKPSNYIEFGLGGTPVDGSLVAFEQPPTSSFIDLVLACLNSDEGSYFFKGCPYHADDYKNALPR